VKKLTRREFLLLSTAEAAVLFLATKCKPTQTPPPTLEVGNTPTNSPPIAPSETPVEPTKAVYVVDTKVPIPTNTLQPPAPTSEPSVTFTPEVKKAEILQFDEMDLKIGGKTVPFTISTEKGPASVLPQWNGWGIKELKFNPLLENPSQKISKWVTANFWWISEAGKKGVSYEEYMKNLDKYQIGVSTYSDYVRFHLNEINKINFRFLDCDDPRLRIFERFGAKAAFEFEENELTVLSGINKNDESMYAVTDPSLRKYKGCTQSIGYMLGQYFESTIMPMRSNSSVEGYKRIDEISNYQYKTGLYADVLPWYKTHSYFNAVLA
jgi:hypothetical protein